MRRTGFMTGTLRRIAAPHKGFLQGASSGAAVMPTSGDRLADVVVQLLRGLGGAPGDLHNLVGLG